MVVVCFSALALIDTLRRSPNAKKELALHCNFAPRVDYLHCANIYTLARGATLELAPR